MTDAGLSSKTAINVEFFKNACGCKRAPEHVIIDTKFLAINDSRFIRAAFVEIIKLAIVGDLYLFEILEEYTEEFIENRLQFIPGEYLVGSAACLFMKMKWNQPFPGGKPVSIRSFGHSFSRKLEQVNRFKVLHGEAVAVEMLITTELAYSIGGLELSERNRINEYLLNLGLPLKTVKFSLEDIWPVFESRLGRDREIHIPIPNRIGYGSYITSLKRDQLLAAIEKVYKNIHG